MAVIAMRKPSVRRKMSSGDMQARMARFV